MLLEFGSFNPRGNLPLEVARKRQESNFVGAFARLFLSEMEGRGFGGKNFALSGFGIADFVWFEGRGGKKTPQITAFEMKMKDWRKAVAQAHRYSYFADQSVVVLPEKTAELAREALETFRRLEVGLWSFSPQTERIIRLYTPTRRKARSEKAKTKAVEQFSTKFNFGKLRKKT